MKPKEPDHVWIIEIRDNKEWRPMDTYEDRRSARLEAKFYYGAQSVESVRIRKYIPVNRLSMEMVVR